MSQEYKHLDDFMKFLKEDQLGSYKVSSGYSYSRKNRSIYWTTSMIAVVLIVSLFTQGYALETRGIMLILSLASLGIAQQVFVKVRKVANAIQDIQVPKMTVHKSNKDNTEGLNIFLLMADLKDIMKMEYEAVCLATVQVWFTLWISWMYADAWQGLVVLLATSCAAIALVGAVYGSMALYNLKKACRL